MGPDAPDSPKARRIAGLARGRAKVAAWPRCGRTRGDGRPCLQPVPTPGECCRWHHGGTARRPRTPRQEAAHRARVAAWAVRRRVIADAPAGVRATPQWRTAERARLPGCLYAFAVAWDALQHGDPAPWRDACARLDGAIANSLRKAARGHSAGVAHRLGLVP